MLTVDFGARTLARYGAMDVEALGQCELPGADGKTRRLGDLWASNPVVLVFARHFG
jgi:hypothetical protein